MVKGEKNGKIYLLIFFSFSINNLFLISSFTTKTIISNFSFSFSTCHCNSVVGGQPFLFSLVYSKQPCQKE